MINFETFIQIMSEYAAAGKYPPVDFSRDTSFHDILRRIDGGPIYVPSTSSGSQVIQQVLNQVSEAQSDEYVAAKGFQGLDTLADTMINTLNTTRNELRDIKFSVNKLVKLINDEFDVRLKKSGVGNARLNLTAEKGTFTPIDWNTVNKVAPMKFIISEVHDMIKVSGTDAVRANLIPLADVLRTKVNNSEMVDIKLTKVDKDAIVAIIQDKVSITSDEINQALTWMTSPSASKVLAGKIGTALKFAPGHGVMCVLIHNAIDCIIPVVSVINKVDLPQLNKDELKKNIDALYTILNAGAYYSHVCRTALFNRSILLSNDMLNPDLAAAFEKDGGCESDIVIHKYFMVTSNVIPTSGLGVDTILGFKDKLQLRAKSELAQSELRIKYETNEIMNDVIAFHLGIYAKDNNCKNAKPLIKAVQEQQVMSAYGLTDILFKFILSLEHQGEFVELLHRKLGASYVEKLTTSDTMNEDDALLAEVGVYTELVVEFIMSKFCN